MGESAYRVSAWWVLPISAVVWWVGGFLPWLLQALYEVIGLTEASAVRSAEFLPIPFTTDDAVVGLVIMALIGGLLGGLTAGIAASARAGAAAATTGTLLAMSAAGGASCLLALRGSAPGDAAPLGMLVVTVAAGVVGLAAGLLTALGPAALRGPALALPVVLLDGWLWGLVPGNLVSPTGTWWTFAVALGIAFGLAVDSRPIELLGWLPTAGIVWVLQAAGPALLAVQENIWPGSALTENPLSAAAIVGHELASAAMVPDRHQLGAWVVALLLGAAIAALRLAREAGDEGELSEALA
ncbi:hypothetical protein [Promicromonospora sp. NPDC023805]|uniref:hypothetical protein n=1 Tax=Promicromonospora sp. NPDC023805 TaxID=3154696 RepID=UPI0033F01EF2